MDTEKLLQTIKHVPIIVQSRVERFLAEYLGNEDEQVPFGGRDASGIGMGGIPYSMHEMTRDKMTIIKSDVLI